MRILLLGDVVGRPGRNAVGLFLKERSYDLVVGNGENAAGGFGITAKTAAELREAGVDVITTGNHVWARRDSWDFLDTEDCPVVRPANYPEDSPGRGTMFLERNGTRVAVANLQGRVFMPDLVGCPFRTADDVLESCGADVVIVDFHAEATSEKEALGMYLDGRVTVLAGTHTHVQTADCQVLPGGTAYVTDLGMCGSSDGIIGMSGEAVVSRFLSAVPVRLKVDHGRMVVRGMEVELDGDLNVSSVKAVDERIGEE
ncbi:metallophosphoesterase [Candidatus Fermentibacteria bacterium]|nr:metallophosphoesterase [Candidatus Fermentibacteria bacterium]